MRLKITDTTGITVAVSTWASPTMSTKKYMDGVSSLDTKNVYIPMIKKWHKMVILYI